MSSQTEPDPEPGPRLKPVANPSPEVAEILSRTLADDSGTPLTIFRTLAHHPRLLKRFNVMGGLFLAHGELPARERELVVLRTAWRSGAAYEWGQHVLIGRRAGLTEDEIIRVTRPDHEAGWPASDATLLRFTDELLDRADVSDESWAVQRERWSSAQLVELMLLVGFYRMVAGFMNATRLQLEDDLPGWPADTGRRIGAGREREDS